MIGIIKEVVNFAIDPINIIIVLGLLTGVTYYRKKIRWSRRLVITLICLFLVTVSSPFPNFLIGHLETKFAPLIDLNLISQDQPVDILVLGSGHTADPHLPAVDQLSSTALQRLSEGLRLFNQLQTSRLIVSGYGNESALSQAEVLKQAAVSLGVSENQIEIQREPSTTAEEASAYLQDFGIGRQLVLVTTASHMPRAMMLFERAGLNPIPAPTGYEIEKDPLEPWNWNLFSARNFYKVEVALHEYVGMLWARCCHKRC